jgi:hypothetical protein
MDGFVAFAALKVIVNSSSDKHRMVLFIKHFDLNGAKIIIFPDITHFPRKKRGKNLVFA